MRENTDQNNSEYGHFLRSVCFLLIGKLAFGIGNSFLKFSGNEIKIKRIFNFGFWKREL